MTPAPAPAPASVPAPPRWLRLVALAEPLTLTVLLFNVALVHDAQLAAAVGPVHGGCYLTIIIGLLAREGSTNRARLLALLPGIGGLLGLRALNRAGRRGGWLQRHLCLVPKDDRSAQVFLTEDRLPKRLERRS